MIDDDDERVLSWNSKGFYVLVCLSSFIDRDGGREG